MTPVPDEEQVVSSSVKTKYDSKFSTVHVVAYVVSAVISRQYSGWQVSFGPGFGGFILGQVMVAFGCVCHYLCLMEIWSAVPFSGGNYALSRATLGFYLGFLDGCLESLVYVGHAALSAYGFGSRICTIFNLPQNQITLYAFCCFLVALAISVQRSVSVLKLAFIVCAVVGVLILVMYCLGTLHWVDFPQNASLHRSDVYQDSANWFQGHWKEWIVILPFTLQPYAGIRSFTLLTNVTDNPKVTLPRAVIWSFIVIISMNILTIFVFASQPPGIETTAHARYPMAAGWGLMFGLEGDTLIKFTNIMQLPVSFSRTFAYLLPSGVLLHSLGSSNLLPSFLCLNHNKDTRNATVVSVVFGMVWVVAYFYKPVVELLNLTVMATMMTDVAFLYGYVLLKTTYSTVPREFTSPFGLWGAAYATCVYFLIFISSAAYQNEINPYFALKFYACFLGILTVYYYAFARNAQTLCEEEDHVFFKMHVRNFNMAKKKRRLFCDRKKNKRVYAANEPGSSSGSGNEGQPATPAARSGVLGGLGSNQVTTQGAGYIVVRPDQKVEDDTTEQIYRSAPTVATVDPSKQGDDSPPQDEEGPLLVADPIVT